MAGEVQGTTGTEVSPAGPIGAYRSSVLVVIGTITDKRSRVLGRVVLMREWGVGCELGREWARPGPLRAGPGRVWCG